MHPVKANVRNFSPHAHLHILTASISESRFLVYVRVLLILNIRKQQQHLDKGLKATFELLLANVIDRTYKLYYGGAQKRPDGNYSMVIRDVEGLAVAQVGAANRKDVRNAVEVARKAQPSWEKRSGFNRAQILYYVAENLSLRKEEFKARLATLTGIGAEAAADEVGAAIRRLFYWAAYCDKFGGSMQVSALCSTIILLDILISTFYQYTYIDTVVIRCFRRRNSTEQSSSYMSL